MWAQALQTRSGPEGSSRRKYLVGHVYQSLTHDEARVLNKDIN